jgi:phosphoglycerol transferase MdoB-like AlkP superfamily enzyme
MKNESAPPESLTDRISHALEQFAGLSIAFFFLICVLRIYEAVIISAKHALPISYARLIIPISVADIIYFLVFSGLISLIIVPLALFFPAASRRTYYTILVIGGMVHFALVQYFSVTLVPLGSDFFGYSWDDIRFTVKTSSGIGFKTFLPYIILAAVITLHVIFGKHLQVGKRIATAFAGISLLALLCSPFLFSAPKDFSTELEYNLSLNKTHYFAVKALQYFIEPAINTADIREEYPLVKDFPYNDVLGPYLENTSSLPNIVVIIAEGLGRDFVGEHARYGGFVPFVDSLTTQSLYWENFLSNSGRTFGVLPSLLGSLPFGEKGFNELEYKMPRHLSLIRLLKQNNYRVNFMYGGNKNFDKKDVFLEREQVDLILDETKFGPEYKKSDANQGGFTWGYPDGDVFRKAIETLAEQRPGPRMDIYLTMSTHEPFIPPNRPYYLRRFNEILTGLSLTKEQTDEYGTYRDQLSSLIYLNDALRYLFTEYSKRPDYNNTIFILTGDHRIIPIPPATKMDRFHVPFIIFSPLVKKPVKFSSVSSHLDVTPSILAFLKSRYAIRLPRQAHWLGDGIDTASAFRNVHSIPFMRVKEETADYLDGKYFVSGEQLFELKPDMYIEEIQDDVVYKDVRAKLDQFKKINKYVVDQNKLYPLTPEIADDDITPEDILAFKGIDSLKLDLDKLFFLAREKAFAGKTVEARLICRRILAAAPNFHDVRTLLGRTYAWNKEYETAKRLFNSVLQRDETYVDAYTALADVQLWNDSAAVSLSVAQKGLTLYPKNEDLHIRAIKAMLSLNRKQEAAELLKKLHQINPNNPDYTALSNRIAAK